DVYQIGLGKADITGALSGRSMLGYADPLQRSQGLHMRLWSRALYLKEVCSHTKSVMVIADLGLIFANLKDEVLKKLDHRYPGVFHSGDVMISATHTHSSGGGYSAHALYNITTLGFDQNALEGTADGIAQSIVKAYETSFLGGIEFHKGELKGAQFNRSIEAYLQNPKAERDLYGSDVDREMQMLVLKDEQGRARGSWNWFPVHGVSLSAKNRLLSGDNKGLAAYQLERVNSRDGIDFIAGFVQSHSGDVSPYEMDDQTEDFLRNEQSAAKQYLKAEELLESPGKRLSGPLQGILKTFDLRNRILSRAPDDKGPLRKTCEGTLGVTFAAGTENGRGLTIFHEGTVYGRDWPRWTLIPEEQDCQAEKVILLPTGLMKPYAWTANVAPFQILRIGSLAVVAVPFEMTTMAGMRLKKTMLAALKDQGIEDVVISALANDYLHYVTTREEYAAQAYEGGSNLFGPWSLDAYLDILDQLAHELGR
ncbi:MAG: alkaline ceramidase, partial [Proteobacteria bacterium]